MPCIVNAPATNITGEIDARPVGLTIGGLITEVTINSTGWTPLPATPLAERNAIAIQNQATVEMKIQYFSGSTGGYVGMIIPANSGERFYAITDNIIIYGRLASGSDQEIVVEELA